MKKEFRLKILRPGKHKKIKTRRKSNQIIKDESTYLLCSSIEGKQAYLQIGHGVTQLVVRRLVVR
jgi:hypothetical protein